MIRFFKNVIKYWRQKRNYYEKKLMQYANDGDVEGVRDCIDHGADVTFEDYLPLKSAASQGHLEVVKTLTKEYGYISYPLELAWSKSLGNGHTDVATYLRKTIDTPINTDMHFSINKQYLIKEILV